MAYRVFTIIGGILILLLLAWNIIAMSAEPDFSDIEAVFRSARRKTSLLI